MSLIRFSLHFKYITCFYFFNTVNVYVQDSSYICVLKLNNKLLIRYLLSDCHVTDGLCMFRFFLKLYDRYRYKYAN